MTPEASEELAAEIYNSVDFGPVQQSDPRYVDLFGEYPEAVGNTDIARLVARQTRLAGNGSVMYLSGLRGTGKSTQLLRVQDKLESDGYMVIRLDAEDYLNVRRPIEIADMLMAIAGGVSNEGAEALGIPDSERFFQRFPDWLKGLLNRVEPTAEVSVEAGFLGAVAANANLKLALRKDESFVAKMREFFLDRLAALSDEANKIVSTIVRQAAEQWSVESPARPWKGLVILFDSLDHAKGKDNDEEDFQSVREAMETVFTSNGSLLRLENARLIVCIPPFVRLTDGVVRSLPTIKVTNRDRSPNASGRAAVRDVLSRRIPGKDLSCLIADDNDVDTLVASSGGNLREVQRLVQEVLVRAATLPADTRTVTAAISTIRADINRSLPADERELLAQIDADRPVNPFHTSADWPRLTPLFDRHLILSYANGDGFYAVHPLVDFDVDAQHNTPG